MKLGLLTFHDTNNFGACLQAIALFNVIKKKGISIEIIDYINPRIYANEVESIKFRFWPLRKFIIWLIYGRHCLPKYRCLQREMRTLIDFSSETYNINDIRSSNNIYSSFIVGSDQVWALNVTQHDYTYYLDFVAEGKKKLSFSSSISDEESFMADRKAQGLLSEFDAISVREVQAQLAIRKAIDRDVPVVCDPTMLLTTKDWDELIRPVEYSSRDYVFIYFTDPSKKIFRDAIEYAEKTGCEVLFCNYGRRVRGTKTVRPKSMREWIGLIKHSRAVFTASYHGMLFALYYNRQFVFYNRNQKSRMQSLSEITGTAANDGEFFKDGVIPEIDYHRVNLIIEKFREESLEILEQTLLYVR